MSGAMQLDLDLATSLFEALARATRRGRVRDSYGGGVAALCVLSAMRRASLV